MEKARNAKISMGVRIMVSVGGGGRSEGFATVAKSAKLRCGWCANVGHRLCAALLLDGWLLVLCW